MCKGTALICLDEIKWRPRRGRGSHERLYALIIASIRDSMSGSWSVGITLVTGAFLPPSDTIKHAFGPKRLVVRARAILQALAELPYGVVRITTTSA